MYSLFQYGAPRFLVRFMVALAWPLIIAGKKFSSYPLLRFVINPFFQRPYNEVTSIPINVQVEPPASVPLPRAILMRLVSEIDQKFIIDTCICRHHNKVSSPPPGIGCMALGPAIRRMHPSHGRKVSTPEALVHIEQASAAGLIANVAHVWIDPAAFWTTFRDLIFICFCDDANCMYRTYMKKRSPNLDKAYQRLPGLSFAADAGICSGCGICLDTCFVNAIVMKNGKASITDDCKGCGRCAVVCPEKAVVMTLTDQEELFLQLASRVNSVADIPELKKYGN
jgi:Pyruvate/2-oxoacid:ferredoxin oxidoreductase delta subunit